MKTVNNEKYYALSVIALLVVSAPAFAYFGPNARCSGQISSNEVIEAELVMSGSGNHSGITLTYTRQKTGQKRSSVHSLLLNQTENLMVYQNGDAILTALSAFPKDFETITEDFELESRSAGVPSVSKLHCVSTGNP